MSSGPTSLPPVNERAGAAIKKDASRITLAVHGITRRPSRALELEDLLRIALKKRFLFVFGQRHAFHGRHLLGYILIWIVHGVEHTVGADHGSCKQDRRLPSHAARRVIDILAHVVADFPFERLETIIAPG